MIHITDVEAFSRHVLNGDGLKIVRFCAEWSGPCQIMGPIYEEMSSMYSNSAFFYQIDIEKVPLLKKEYGVTELPTILFFHNREIIDFITGLYPRETLIEKLEKAIK